MSERKFQQWFVKEWEAAGMWVENIHPSFGTKTGIPDLLVMAAKLLIPIELKTGELVGESLSVSDIRPAQIRWANQFYKAGGISGLIVGVPDGKSWKLVVVKNSAWWQAKTVFEEGEFAVTNNTFSAVAHVLAQ